MVSMHSVCTIDGCDNLKNSRLTGYCMKHQHRYERHGDPMFVKRIHYRHGMTGTPEYKAWRAMQDRCNNKNYPNYNRWGGRGIKVCERWLSFENFLEDMGRRPDNKKSIDRIDNDGDYTPENCRWATNIEQGSNLSSNVNIEIDGHLDTLANHARRVGLPRGTVTSRFYRGLDNSRLLDPVKESYKNRKRGKYNERH